jgi:hypothetical protein
MRARMVNEGRVPEAVPTSDIRVRVGCRLAGKMRNQHDLSGSACGYVNNADRQGERKAAAATTLRNQ